MQRLGKNFSIHFVRILIVIWWQTRQHFVKKYSQSPPVYSLVVSLPEEKLGSEIFGCATKR